MFSLGGSVPSLLENKPRSYRFEGISRDMSWKPSPSVPSRQQPEGPAAVHWSPLLEDLRPTVWCTWVFIMAGFIAYSWFCRKEFSTPPTGGSREDCVPLTSVQAAPVGLERLDCRMEGEQSAVTCPLSVLLHIFARSCCPRSSSRLSS